MKRIDFSLGGGWGINVYFGKEWPRFLKKARELEKQYCTSIPALDLGPSKNIGLSVGYCIYLKDKKNILVMVHELIHVCTWTRNHISMDDSPLQEWLAYTVQYCMEKLK